MKKFIVGVQLYSVRRDLEADMEGTLRKIKEIGYDYVEFAGYYGRSAEQVKELLDKYDLKCLSVHQSPTTFVEQGQEAVDFLKKFGVKYVAVPWYERSKLAGTDEWENTKKMFNDVAKLLSDNGMQMLYHNHDFEFEKVNGKYVFDCIYDEIPQINPEIDTCWVNYAGVNPCEVIEKYSGKVNVVHLKDFVCTKLAQGPVYALIDENGSDGKKSSKEDNGFEFRPLGRGIQDFDAILASCEKSGTEYVIVEQDESNDIPALKAVEISRKYLASKAL